LSALEIRRVRAESYRAMQPKFFFKNALRAPKFCNLSNIMMGTAVSTTQHISAPSNSF
jgi:hypothetical protein